MDYKYSLRNGSKKDECPSCGKKTFKPYVDTVSKKEVSPKFGRCERVNSCGYSIYPNIDKDFKLEPRNTVFEPIKPIEYISKEIVEKTFNDFKSNVFFNYLTKTFGGQKAMELQEKYNIGTAKGGGCIFWQQDSKGLFRTGKVMYYGENGKRDKNKMSWFVHKKIKDDFNFQQCFFGLHLVDGKSKVALCESEKTAVLMSVYMPEYTWVSAGGSEMVNSIRLNELSRLDKVFPDGGMFEKWEQKTRFFESRQMDLTVELASVNGLIPNGSDILDLIQLNL